MWFYPDSEYPVVQITGGQPRAWWPAKSADTAPAGVHTLAVAGDLVALVGGYTDREAGRVTLVDLNADHWVTRQTV